MIQMTVRLDDITPDMDWERFWEVKALLDRYGIKPLIGVVPDNRDGMLRGSPDSLRRAAERIREKTGDNTADDTALFWRYIGGLKQEGWEISMHGFQHRYTTKKRGCFPLNPFSEFAGLPLQKQEAMLAEGKRLLKAHGIETDLFMPPAHSYDRRTLQALKRTGFAGVTDGFGKRPYRWKGLTFYPISFHLRRTLKKNSGFSTMVIHPATVSKEELKRYESYFTIPHAEWIPYGTYLRQEPVRAGLFLRCREYGMALGKSLIAGLRRRQ